VSCECKCCCCKEPEKKSPAPDLINPVFFAAAVIMLSLIGIGQLQTNQLEPNRVLPLSNPANPPNPALKSVG
jgi:hypothetical protein